MVQICEGLSVRLTAPLDIIRTFLDVLFGHQKGWQTLYSSCTAVVSVC